MAEIMEVQTAILRPAVVESCLLQRPPPDTAEVVGRKRPARPSASAGRGEHQTDLPGVELRAMPPRVVQLSSSSAVQRDRVPRGLRLWAFEAAAAAAAGVTERPDHAQPAGTADGAVLQRLVQPKIFLAQRGQLAQRRPVSAAGFSRAW
jgi:hypothetical protein